MTIECPSTTMTIRSIPYLSYTTYETQLEQCKPSNTHIVFEGDCTVEASFTYNRGWQTKEIDFGSGAVLITNQAFRQCTNLEKVIIGPNTKRGLSVNPFATASPNIVFEVDPSNPHFRVIDDCLYSLQMLVCIPTRKTSVTVPADVNEIAGLVAYGSSNIGQVTILTNAITFCEHSPFMNTPLLTITGAPYGGTRLIAVGTLFWVSPGVEGEVIVSRDISAISYGAFYNCDKITSVRIQSRTIKMSGIVFNRCASLTTVTFCGATTLQSDTFLGSSVAKLIFKNENVVGLAAAMRPTIVSIQIPCAASDAAFAGVTVPVIRLCTKEFTIKKVVSLAILAKLVAFTAMFS